MIKKEYFAGRELGTEDNPTRILAGQTRKASGPHFATGVWQPWRVRILLPHFYTYTDLSLSHIYEFIFIYFWKIIFYLFIFCRHFFLILLEPEMRKQRKCLVINWNFQTPKLVHLFK
ncbi:hypothetical protein ABFX02_10G122800 [Erythranthe guttata]